MHLTGCSMGCFIPRQAGVGRCPYYRNEYFRWKFLQKLNCCEGSLSSTVVYAGLERIGDNREVMLIAVRGSGVSYGDGFSGSGRDPMIRGCSCHGTRGVEGHNCGATVMLGACNVCVSDLGISVKSPL